MLAPQGPKKSAKVQMARYCFLLECLNPSLSIILKDQIYRKLVEVPSVAWVFNVLSVDAVYPIVLLYPPETLVPSLSCRNLLLGSLLCPMVC